MRRLHELSASGRDPWTPWPAGMHPDTALDQDVVEVAKVMDDPVVVAHLDGAVPE